MVAKNRVKPNGPYPVGGGNPVPSPRLPTGPQVIIIYVCYEVFNAIGQNCTRPYLTQVCYRYYEIDPTPLPKTCLEAGWKECSPHIRYVSGDPDSACQQCNGGSLWRAVNGNNLNPHVPPRRRNNPIEEDYIDSDGFMFMTVWHYVCKRPRISDAGVSILCGKCCVNTQSGPRLEDRCKCARTGGD